MAVCPFLSMAARMPFDFIPIRVLSSFILVRVVASCCFIANTFAMILVFFRRSTERHLSLLLAQYLICFLVMCFRFGCFKSYFFVFFVSLVIRLAAFLDTLAGGL